MADNGLCAGVQATLRIFPITGRGNDAGSGLRRPLYGVVAHTPYPARDQQCLPIDWPISKNAPVRSHQRNTKTSAFFEGDLGR